MVYDQMLPIISGTKPEQPEPGSEQEPSGPEQLGPESEFSALLE